MTHELTATIERALVGGVLAGGSLELAHVRASVISTDLGDTMARAVFTAACDVADRGGEVSPVTVAAALERVGDLGAVGGLPGLDALGASARPGERAALISRTLSHSRVRTIAHRSQRLAEIGATAEALDDPDRYLASVAHVAGSARDQLRSGSVLARDAASIAFQAWYERSKSQRASTTGNAMLDHAYGGGHQTKRLYVDGARPAVGKSALLISSIYSAAASGHPQLSFNREMPVEDILGRAVVQRLGLDSERYALGRRGLVEGEIRSVISEFDALSQMPVELNVEEADVGSMLAMAMVWLETVARPMIAEDAEANGGVIRLVPKISIDYLQRCRLAGKFGNREEMISEMSNRLATFARDQDCAAQVLCQLGRANKKESRPPRADDLRGSGGIEQDANVITLIHRDAGVSEDEDDRGRVVEQAAEFRIDKNRHGPTRIVRATFHGPSGRFLAPRLYGGEEDHR
jgi:replicative DNA helicase